MLGMRRFRTGLITVVLVAVLVVGGLIAFRVLDEKRAPAALPSGGVVDHSTCLAPEVLSAAIPVPVQPPEPMSDALPPAGTIPDDFEPTSVVVCQFLEYTNDSSEAVLLETSRIGDMAQVVAQLNRESPKSPWSGECPTASSASTPVVWLVDATGNAVRVALPVDGMCGYPLPEAYEAVMTLEVQNKQLHFIPLAP